MVDYQNIRRTHGRLILQTLDSPISVFEIWQLSDIFFVLLLILILGIVSYQWALLMISIGMVLGFAPHFRKNYPRGYLLHWIAFRLGMTTVRNEVEQ